MKYILLPGVMFMILSFAANTLFAAEQVKTFPLKYRTAQEVIPIIKPFLDKDSAVTGQGFTLIIRAPDESLKQINELIKQLDRAPKRLQISVRQQRADENTKRDIGVSGSIKSGDARIQLNEPGPARLNIYESNRRSARNGIQTINTIEGRQAFIQVGQLVPVAERNIDRFGNQREIIQYKHATTGFYVLPRLSGDQVSLDISPHSVSLNRHGQQTFDIQQAQTTLRGKIGEWMSIGGINQQDHSSNQGITHSTRRNDVLNSDFQIRVEIIAE